MAADERIGIDDAQGESALYAPVKRYLETLGFDVKGEIGGCDVVGVRPGEPPVLVICELKLSFSLELVLQAVDRARAGDEVWIAARLSRNGRGREADSRFRNLCRRLGLGMLVVAHTGKVDVILSPEAAPPRRDARRRSVLLREHSARKGDPARGGSTRTPLMTAYRQEALVCATRMAEGPQRPRDLRALAPRAPAILRDNVYGWFERVERGVYGLTPAGLAALERWADPGASPPG